MMMDCVILNY